jgi:predicted O-methyltransferase YrrM
MGSSKNKVVLKELLELRPPDAWQKIKVDTDSSGFTMASDDLTGSLLRTLAAAKPSGRILELGTGSGLSTAWMLDGMDERSTLTSIDNNPDLLAIANLHLGRDERLDLVLADAGQWLASNTGETYNMIFADTWHGKYLMLDEALAMLSSGGLYVIDDMLPQPNWPDGHAEKARILIETLTAREDLRITPLDWSTGLFIAVKR